MGHTLPQLLQDPKIYELCRDELDFGFATSPGQGYDMWDEYFQLAQQWIDKVNQGVHQDRMIPYSIEVMITYTVKDKATPNAFNKGPHPDPAVPLHRWQCHQPHLGQEQETPALVSEREMYMLAGRATGANPALYRAVDCFGKTERFLDALQPTPRAQNLFA